ncbi:MAG: hypothetical protein MJ201_05100 [Mycoplasmoidaceae bacterium]|nr:hypothetical protein [Mycoplasmoidaceae bacterium]
MLEQATKEINSLIHSVVVAKTYNIANDTFFKEPAPVSNEFADALNDDLNIPNAITVLMKEISMLNNLVREKKFADSNKLCCVIAKELEILGLRNDNIDHVSSVGLIKG